MPFSHIEAGIFSFLVQPYTAVTRFKSGTGMHHHMFMIPMYHLSFIKKVKPTKRKFISPYIHNKQQLRWQTFCVYRAHQLRSLNRYLNKHKKINFLYKNFKKNTAPKFINKINTRAIAAKTFKYLRKIRINLKSIIILKSIT